MSPSDGDRAVYGTGVGLRGPHVPHILRDHPPVPWFELLTDNHLAPGGALRWQAEAIAERYPVTLHGVGMSLGSVSPLNRPYIERVKKLAERTRARWISEHLAFTGIAGRNSHDLLPLPRTAESLNHVIRRVDQVQDCLEQQILIENVTSYVEFRDSSLSEATFLREICAATGCGLLLDLNNAYVNSVNHGWDLLNSLDEYPWDAVAEIHLAGFDVRDRLLIDTHGSIVDDRVIDLLERLIHRAPLAPVLLEWDTQLPGWELLWSEAQRIECARARGLEHRQA